MSRPMILIPPLFLTVFCFVSLLTSPYTGLRLTAIDGKPTVVAAVDSGSPARQAGIEPGDLLLTINGREISYPAFVVDPDEIPSRKDLIVFWEAQRWLDQSLGNPGDLILLMERGGKRTEITLSPTHFSAKAVVGRIGVGYFLSWSVFLIFYLLFRKKQNEITSIFLALGFGIVIGDVSAVTYSARDLTFPFLPFRALDLINFLALFAVYSLLLHLALVFPRRKKIVHRHPGALKALYGVMGFVVLVDGTAGSDGQILTSAFFELLIKTVFVGILLFSFLTEKSPVGRKQAQWVFFGFMTGFIPKVFLIRLPVFLSGVPLISPDNLFFVLANLILPVTIVIAVTRYHLMDIDLIFDHAVNYGLVLVVLGGIEWGLLSVLSGYYVNGNWGLPYAPLLLVLPIVLLYLPLRNGIREGVKRLFKRKPYHVEREVRRFIAALGEDPAVPVLNKFSIFIRETLVPSGILILGRPLPPASFEASGNPQCGEFSIRLVYGIDPDYLSQEIGRSGEALWRHFEERRSAVYGYELLDLGIVKASGLENSLWVPIFVKARLAHVTLLLEKWNNTAYSINDRALLDTLSMSVGHFLDAEEMRKNLREMEGSFRKHQDHVMKEIHDGLGSILSHITIAAQVLERSYPDDILMARKMIGVLNESSLEATDFLRAGLNILDHPEGKIWEVIPEMKHRLGDMLRAYGVDLEVNMSEEVKGMKMSAHQSLHLFRCLQEALHNVLKHSGACRVSVVVCRENGDLSVIIADNGKGFEENSETLKGYGLQNMSQRMEELGGTLKVVSSPGMGTRIALSIPVSPPIPLKYPDSEYGRGSRNMV